MTDKLKLSDGRLVMLIEHGDDDHFSMATELLAARATIEALEKENRDLAASICPTFYGDEHGNPRCKEQDELRSIISRMR